MWKLNLQCDDCKMFCCDLEKKTLEVLHIAQIEDILAIQIFLNKIQHIQANNP